MGSEQEAVVRSLLDAIVTGDRDAAVACFAADAEYHVSSWHEPVVGHEAIRAELERQASIFTDFRYDILNVASTDSVVFTERLDSMTVADKPVTLHWASVHVIGPRSLIRHARDYYDMKELEARLFG